MMAEIEERERTEWRHMDEEEKTKRRKAYWALKLEEKEREMVVERLREQQAVAAQYHQQFANEGGAEADPSGAAAGIDRAYRHSMALQQAQAQHFSGAGGKRVQDMQPDELLRAASDRGRIAASAREAHRFLGQFLFPRVSLPMVR